MAEPARWHKSPRGANAFLVALDISGFSRFMYEPNQLLEHRERFFYAVENTDLFAGAKEAGTVVVHFLGDELRLAFRGSVGAQSVYTFLEEVLATLDADNIEVHTERQTRVKGTVFTGVVSWREWRGCDFLDGSLPFKAQHWMGLLKPGEIAADKKFRDALESAALPIGELTECDFGGETGYLLRKEA
jgi:hypothetical protein